MEKKQLRKCLGVGCHKLLLSDERFLCKRCKSRAFNVGKKTVTVVIAAGTTAFAIGKTILKKGKI